MKSGWIFAMILLGFVVTGCNPNGGFPIPDSTQVQSVHYVPKQPGNTVPNRVSIDLSNNPDITIKLITWLQDAKFAGNAPHQLKPKGGSPSQLDIVFRNGNSLTIEDAIDAISTPVTSGMQIHSQQVPDQITIYQSGKDPIRVISPQLKTWIESGWKVDVWDE
jgi:hypothetical protein